MNVGSIQELAAIEYHGSEGITQNCLRAIARLIQFGDPVREAKLVSHVDSTGGAHGFLLVDDVGHVVGIKSGFSSGYNGEGPNGLSTALQLLTRHEVEIYEYRVSEDFIARLDASCLTNNDIEVLDERSYIRPPRWRDYIHDYEQEEAWPRHLARQFPPIVPFNIIDARIFDLAIELPSSPDGVLTTAYRRLEDVIRSRTGLTESGSKLFAKALVSEESILHWDDRDKAEHVGKANLFVSVFNAFRNPRAHRELSSSPSELLREFLLINELFVLESKAQRRPGNDG